MHCVPLGVIVLAAAASFGCGGAESPASPPVSMAVPASAGAGIETPRSQHSASSLPRRTGACYERSAARAAGQRLEGRITFGWDIAPDGTVSRIVLLRDELGRDELTQCIVSRLRETRFPATSILEPARVEKTWHFVPP